MLGVHIRPMANNQSAQGVWSGIKHGFLTRLSRPKAPNSQMPKSGREGRNNRSSGQLRQEWCPKKVIVSLGL
jgi:hypothetical protein